MPRTRIRRAAEAAIEAPAVGFVVVQIGGPIRVAWIDALGPDGRPQRRSVERARRFDDVWAAFRFGEAMAQQQRCRTWIVGYAARPEANREPGPRLTPSRGRGSAVRGPSLSRG